MPKKLKEKISFNADKTGFFRYKKLGADYLVTSDTGEYEFVSPAAFLALAGGTLKPGSADYKRLAGMGLVRDYMDFNSLSARFRGKNHFLLMGPSLHIVVLTRRCNHSCVYCQATAVKSGAGLDMTKATAAKVLDAIFSSPAASMNIEFQGGEPFLNWPVLEYAVKEAKARAKASGKKIGFSVVTNLSEMTEERLNFLVKNDVAVCTSLDGPEDLHNKNRACGGFNSYKTTVKWFTRIKKKTSRTRNGPDALLTVTRQSLGRHKDIVDEYLRLGARGIFLRFLNPFGAAKAAWPRIGYTAAEYLDFYRKALGYVIDLNLKGKTTMVEHTARIFLKKILTAEDPNYMDLRSPCGAGVGQLAYDHDGRVFTCDEGRMMAVDGVESFCLGDLKTDSYKDVISSPVVKCMVTASVTDIQALCSSCVYKPYCGVCPVFNYAEHNDLYMHHPNYRCEIYTGVLDYLFERLREPDTAKLFKSWAVSGEGVAGAHI